MRREDGQIVLGLVLVVIACMTVCTLLVLQYANTAQQINRREQARLHEVDAWPVAP